MNLLRKIFAKNKTKDYVSPIEEFMQKFDEKNQKKSVSQQKEIMKFKKIFYLRDHVVQTETNKLWEGF